MIRHPEQVRRGGFCAFSSLPEVPALVDVPCVSAQLDDSLLGLLRDRVSRLGSVSSHPPVQIEELQERPGSILVRWCKVSKGVREPAGDIQSGHVDVNMIIIIIIMCVRQGGRGLCSSRLSAAVPAVGQRGEPV